MCCRLNSVGCQEAFFMWGKTMKRFLASVVVAIALLISGVAVTQFSVVGTAYADGGSD